MKALTFASLMKEFEPQYNLGTAFDDFLTMTICAFSRNPATGLSHDEELYMKTIEPYKEHPLRHNFPKMVAQLTNEMEARQGSIEGSDVLGEFYQENLYKKNSHQFFTPWGMCQLLADMALHEIPVEKKDRPLRILEPCCGSGRITIIASRIVGPGHEHYGIDIDHTCVKMAAINLFLHGIFNAEVLCADMLMPDDFRISYRISFLPLV